MSSVSLSQCSAPRTASALKRASVARRASRPARAVAPVRALFGGNKDGQGGGNPFANMGQLMENVKKAQVLVQQETARMQQELSEMEFEGFNEEETVRVVLNGNQQPVTVDITDEAMAMGAEGLSNAVTAALKEAHGKSTDGMKAKMRDLAATLGLPAGAGLGGGPGM